ncbi:MAG: DinB family protein [Armatimonadetes bacterium]|nr:DinB family protein [Armatimonadota bacterium]
MSPYAEVWKFTRERLAPAYQDLSPRQLCWRPHASAMTIGEMLYHVAGAEHWFGKRLQGEDPYSTEMDARIDKSVRAQFINEDPFPFSEEDMTVEQIDAALRHTENLVRPLLEDPSHEALTRMVETPLGPTVEGVGGLWRIAQHAAYHTGQIWAYRQRPDFPA